MYDRLTVRFDRQHIFMDIDGIRVGADFVKTIEKKVSECDVLVAVIGERWLTSKDEQGGRRLDNPEDFVRMEIATALKREIWVIPVLVDGALIPRSLDLPDDLKPLVRRNALRVSDTGFDDDCRRLVTAIEEVFDINAAEQREREEKERLDAEQREKERLEAVRQQKERLEAEQREKQRLESERQEKELLDAASEKQRVAAQQREKERVEVDQRESERIDSERRQKERREAEARQGEQEERLKAEKHQQERLEKERLESLQRETKGKAQQEEEATPPPPILKPTFSREDPGPLRLLAIALVLITAIGVIWFAAHRERTVALVAPTPTPARTPTPTPTPTLKPTPTPTPKRDAEAIFNRGVAYYKDHDYGRAIDDFTEAIGLNPTYASAYKHRGSAYERINEFRKAKADFAKAQELEKAGQ